MIQVNNEKTDRAGYNDYYNENLSDLAKLDDCDNYIKQYESTRIGPFFKSGHSKGYVRGEAVRRLLAHADQSGQPRSDITILDAGSGQGELSVYLACKGFNVIGIDISSEAKACADHLASKVGADNRCTFYAESLEDIPVEDASIDYVIGHASLHHFIKYDKVPSQFLRVMKDNAKGYFSDSFGENKIYHIFHNKEKMDRLGDVTLTRNLIESYFSNFELRLTPTDWFVMLDKIYIKILPSAFAPIIKKLSALHFWLDRLIPETSRISLFLSGAVLTEIQKIDSKL